MWASDGMDTRTAPPPWAIGLPVAAHVIIALLDFGNRAAFQTLVPTVVGNLVDHPAWTTIHAGIALILMVSTKPPRVAWALCTSFAALLIWGGINFYVGLAANHPVSLLGPSLVMLLASFSLVLAHKWFVYYEPFTLRYQKDR